MITKMVSFLSAAFLLVSHNVLGYEQATHALITNSALLRSDLVGASGEMSSPLVRSLGLDGYRPLGNGRTYFEFIGTLLGVSAYERTSQRFEQDILDRLKLKWRETPIQSWVLFGAIREDDNPSESPPTPQDVEAGIRRPLHHFFDPYFNLPLTADGLSQLDDDVQKSVDWALGVQNSFDDANSPRSPRRNHFTIPDAREAMFRALTLKTPGAATYDDIASEVDAATRQRWRQNYWATTLRALGDVLHLNQDMAQPQHTRNEAHSGKLCGTRLCLGGHTSVYEKYMNGRALGDQAFDSLAPFHAQVAIQAEPLPFGPYPIPQFWTYPAYWSTSPGTGSLSGKGLADYSNHGFFTAANNLGSNPYIAPSNDHTDYQVGAASPFGWDGTVTSDSQPTFILFGPVVDAFALYTDTHVPMTSFGMWDQFLTTKSLPSKYTLNRLNYDAMALLLLPRAASYSAGLINFFFRGRLDITLPDEGVFALADHGTTAGFKSLRMKIKNVTPDFVDAQGGSQPQHMSGRVFFAVVRYHKDKQYVDNLDNVVGVTPCADYSDVVDTANLDASTQCREGVEEIVVSKPLFGISLDAGQQQQVEFDFSDTPIPYGITDVVMQVVYRGGLGSELDAIAVGTLDASEPTYFTYQNATDYIHIGGHVYTRGQVDASSELLAQVQPQYCVDYRESPPHLVAGCLEQFKIDLTVSFADLANPIAEVKDLPNHRFMRLVWLTTADDDSSQTAKKASRGLKITARRHGGEEKSLLFQQSTCLPLDPFDIYPRHSQMTVISSTQISYRIERLAKLRGVNGWYNTSCVVNGDSAEPGTTDDRNSVMTPLLPDSEEVRPYPVEIMPAYL